MLYDVERLLVAHSGASPTCRTPHFVADLFTALLAHDATAALRRVSNGGEEAEFTVRGSSVAVRVVDLAKGTVAVRCADNKFVLAHCLRCARVPNVDGETLMRRFVVAYAEGRGVARVAAAGAPRKDLAYLEAAPVVESIRMLLPETSEA